jgi:hypothetical protein
MPSNKTTDRKPKVRLGRPPTTGIGTLIGVRCHDDLLHRVDTWRARQEEKTTRPDAIRSLTELGLKHSRV